MREVNGFTINTVVIQVTFFVRALVNTTYKKSQISPKYLLYKYGTHRTAGMYQLHVKHFYTAFSPHCILASKHIK